MAITRDEVRLNLKKVQDAKQALEKKNKKAPSYATTTKYIPYLGYVAELATLRECAKALAHVQSKFTNENAAASELGIEETDIQEEQNYLGFDLETWKSDIQIRVSQLKDVAMMEKLTNAETKLKKHRSADDIFQDDMEDIEGLVAGL